MPTLSGMPESASELPQGVVWDEPIARTAIEEVCGLIGHDPADVISISIRTSVVLVEVIARSADGRKILTDDRPEIGFLVRTHRHSIL